MYLVLLVALQVTSRHCWCAIAWPTRVRSPSVGPLGYWCSAVCHTPRSGTSSTRCTSLKCALASHHVSNRRPDLLSMSRSPHSTSKRTYSRSRQTLRCSSPTGSRTRSGHSPLPRGASSRCTASTRRWTSTSRSSTRAGRKQKQRTRTSSGSCGGIGDDDYAMCCTLSMWICLGSYNKYGLCGYASARNGYSGYSMLQVGWSCSRMASKRSTRLWV